MACIFLWSSAVRIHDLQAYRKMDVTRECISCIVELRENPVSAAVVCAVLESISGLEPSSVITEPKYACDSLKLLSVYFDLWVDATGVVYHQFGLLGTDLHTVGCEGFVKMLN